LIKAPASIMALMICNPSPHRARRPGPFDKHKLIAGSEVFQESLQLTTVGTGTARGRSSRTQPVELIVEGLPP
jgi:hypothetical protein